MWNERYAQNDFIYGQVANDFLQAQSHHIAPEGQVLCLAEGQGRNAVYLAQQGFQVTAVDLSSVGLAAAQRLAQSRGVEITTQVADLAEFDFGQQQWDAIVSISAHVPGTLRQHLHKSVVEALKPKGVFILEAYTPDQLNASGVGGPPASQKDFFMTLAALKSELTGLEFELGQELIREMDEGEFHQGTSAVVQVLASKPS